MSRTAKFIILMLLLLAISLPIVSSVNAGAKNCNGWVEACLSSDGNQDPNNPRP